jgi:hypothetical protein
MRCLTPIELVELFGPIGFSVVSNPHLHRTALRLAKDIAARQNRVGGRPTPDLNRLTRFTEALNRWHPTNRHRLLWVDHWADYFPSTYALFMAARTGLSESRSLSEAPGHYFDPFPYDERDQLRISTEQGHQTGILIGLMSLLMMNGWDGWLVAEGSVDRIEFWEGNVFFHSDDKERLMSAKALMHQFECPQDLN